MKLLVAVACLLVTVGANNSDRFNYRGTEGRDFGPEDWNSVECDDPGVCTGFPDPWTVAIGWDLEDTQDECEICVDNDVHNNACRSCPATGNDCGQHRQSPIDLLRDRAIPNHDDSKECPDWHWMRYNDGACEWEDFVNNDDSIHRNNFLIQRHGLQILQPVDDDGELSCFNETLGGQLYPRLDYSKGFPDWWKLSHTEVSVPSEHTQEGVRYDAEVTLAHFYEVEHYKNQLGKVTIFMNAYDDIEPWPMLDKLICQWRETEERVREDCGFDSVATYYPGCTNYDRGHTPQPITPTVAPTSAPVTRAPTTVRIVDEPVVGSGGAAVSTPSPANDRMTPFPAPTEDFSANVFPECFICGSETQRITNPDVVLFMPAYPPFPCSEFENAGLFGFIDPGFCDLFPVFVGACGCQETDTVGLTTPAITDTPAPAASKVVDVTPAPVAAVTSAPAAASTTAPVAADTSAPISVPETDAPIAPSPATTAPIDMSRFVTDDTDGKDPPFFSCPAFDDVVNVDVNYRRMCKPGLCCDENRRSAIDFCHDAYSFFESVMPSVCFHCCDEPKIMAPAPAPHPVFEPIECSDIENPRRICDPESRTSCCGERSDTPFCQETYALFPGLLMHSLCWYCCESPLEVEEADDDGARRGLRSLEAFGSTVDEAPEERNLRLLMSISELDEEQQAQREALRHELADARVKMLKVKPENYEFPEEEDDDVFFESLWERHLENEGVTRDEEERRRLQLVNYEDVDYWPYEWLLKVRTEYYFRYEGTQAVPPCKDQVHYRVMKDPIQVHQRQIDELERLMAQRIAPNDAQPEEVQCTNDHAGKPREANPAKFDFVRPLQSLHTLHRKVFCECQKWKSKFDEDRDWCRRNIFNRLFEHPYNFESEDVFI